MGSEGGGAWAVRVGRMGSVSGGAAPGMLQKLTALRLPSAHAAPCGCACGLPLQVDGHPCS